MPKPEPPALLSPRQSPWMHRGMTAPNACCHSISTERLPVRHRIMFSRNQVLGRSNLILREVGLSWIFWLWSSGCPRKLSKRAVVFCDTMRKSFLDSKLPFISHRCHQVISRGCSYLWSEARMMDDALCSSISSRKRLVFPQVFC